MAPGHPTPTIAADTFTAHDGDLAWAAFAASRGLDDERRRALVLDLEAAVRRVTGVGFGPTPFRRDGVLSDELGFASTGGVWVKDETHAVAGSQKVRHLVTILLHLRAAELVGQLERGLPLAIASCGNAALAAATLAKADGRVLDVYVPTWTGATVLDELTALGARVHRCARRVDDPPGDPAMHRFRDAVAGGAVPFTVQGPENALCLDGGRTIGWEIAEQFATDPAADDGRPPDRVLVQVGGGALATALGAGLHDAVGPVRLDAVQAEGCAPLERAWRRAGGRHGQAVGAHGSVGVTGPDPVTSGSRWNELMTAWESPRSAADGILDDETYDWLGVFAAMRCGGGRPVVAAESTILAAHELARRAGYDVSATGSAGLAGLLTIREAVGDAERVVVVMSGVGR
jgi:threonine dehydratase